MNFYKLTKFAENGPIVFYHSGCMFPSVFQKKINNWAGEEIAKMDRGSSFMGLITCFSIEESKLDLFNEKVFPNIGFKQEGEEWIVWDKDEENPEI